MKRKKAKFKVRQVIMRKSNREYVKVKGIRLDSWGNWLVRWGGNGQNGGCLYQERFRPLTKREKG